MPAIESKIVKVPEPQPLQHELGGWRSCRNAKVSWTRDTVLTIAKGMKARHPAQFISLYLKENPQQNYHHNPTLPVRAPFGKFDLVDNC